MQAFRCNTRIDDRGQLRLFYLPFRPGAEVEVIVLARASDEPPEKPSPRSEPAPPCDLLYDPLFELPRSITEVDETSSEELLEEAEEEEDLVIPKTSQSKESVDRSLRALGTVLAKTLGERPQRGAGERSPQTAETPANGDALVDEDELREELRVAVEKMLRSLEPRRELVLRMRCGIGEMKEHTVKEVARAFDVTPSRIRELQSRALRQLCHKRHRDEVQDLLHKLRRLPEISSG